MSKTVRNTPSTSKNEQLRRLNAMRGYRPQTPRDREAMRERAFTAIYARG